MAKTFRLHYCDFCIMGITLHKQHHTLDLHLILSCYISYSKHHILSITTSLQSESSLISQATFHLITSDLCSKNSSHSLVPFILYSIVPCFHLESLHLSFESISALSGFIHTLMKLKPMCSEILAFGYCTTHRMGKEPSRAGPAQKQA